MREKVSYKKVIANALFLSESICSRYVAGQGLARMKNFANWAK